MLLWVAALLAAAAAVPMPDSCPGPCASTALMAASNPCTSGVVAQLAPDLAAFAEGLEAKVTGLCTLQPCVESLAPLAQCLDSEQPASCMYGVLPTLNATGCAINVITMVTQCVASIPGIITAGTNCVAHLQAVYTEGFEGTMSCPGDCHTFVSALAHNGCIHGNSSVLSYLDDYLGSDHQKTIEGLQAGVARIEEICSCTPWDTLPSLQEIETCAHGLAEEIQNILAGSQNILTRAPRLPPPAPAPPMTLLERIQNWGKGKGNGRGDREEDMEEAWLDTHCGFLVAPPPSCKLGQGMEKVQTCLAKGKQLVELGSACSQELRELLFTELIELTCPASCVEFAVTMSVWAVDEKEEAYCTTVLDGKADRFLNALAGLNAFLSGMFEGGTCGTCVEHAKDLVASIPECLDDSECSLLNDFVVSYASGETRCHSAWPEPIAECFESVVSIADAAPACKTQLSGAAAVLLNGTGLAGLEVPEEICPSPCETFVAEVVAGKCKYNLAPDSLYDKAALKQQMDAIADALPCSDVCTQYNVDAIRTVASELPKCTDPTATWRECLAFIPPLFASHPCLPDEVVKCAAFVDEFATGISSCKASLESFASLVG